MAYTQGRLYRSNSTRKSGCVLAYLQVLNNKVVKLTCMLMLETPEGPSSSSTNTTQSSGSKQLHYKMATKTYFFHYSR